MLVLTRRRTEKIMIGDNVSITVLSARGDRVRLGIEAPAEIRGGTVRATLPEHEKIVWFLTVTDTRGATVSTPHQ